RPGCCALSTLLSLHHGSSKPEETMGNKVQGEGDYESARRYNQHTEESARKTLGKAPPDSASAEDRRAEDVGSRTGKDLKHDSKDEELMKQPVDKKSTD